MPLCKLALILFLTFAIAAPASAQNTTPRSYLHSTAKSLGNNADIRTESGRKAWSKKTKSDARNFANKEYKNNRKEPRWKQKQRTRMKKQSNVATSGVNE